MLVVRRGCPLTVGGDPPPGWARLWAEHPSGGGREPPACPFGEVWKSPFGLRGNRKQLLKAAHLTAAEAAEPALAASPADRAQDGFGTSGQPAATLDGWQFRAKNLLMYDSSQRDDAPLTQRELEERAAGPAKEISQRNTRFHNKQLAGGDRGGGETVAILYEPVGGATPMPFAERDAARARQHYDLGDLRRTPAGGPGAGERGFVVTPSPAPGEGESPFMTWGDIEGTPVRLEAEDTPISIGGSADGPHFRIPAPPPRDERAVTLSRSAQRSLRERAKLRAAGTQQEATGASPFRNGSTPSPLLPSSSPVTGSWSAAAQKLVDKAMLKSKGSVDTKLRESYSASPFSPAAT
eukprot:SM000052S17731  [mRNA]  locus=s52:332265:334101:- [translate_table: standard]